MSIYKMPWFWSSSSIAIELCTALKLVTVAASYFQHTSSMASGVKIALMFALMAAMAMAVQAGSHHVSCTNKYCKPITVNNVTIGAGLTLDFLVDDVLGILTCVAPDIFGNLITTQCGCPLKVITVTIIEQGMGLVLVFTCGTLSCPVGLMPFCLLSSNPPLCL